MLSKTLQSYSEQVQSVHNRKLSRLGIQIPKFIDPKTTVFNYSDYVLSKREEFVLSLGLDFCLPNFKPTFNKFYLPIENLFTRLKALKLPSDLSVLQNDLQTIAQKTYQKSNQNWLPFFHKSDYELLKNLSKNPDVVIAKPDKGRGTVILNKTDYLRKMDDILKDNTKFLELGPPTFQPIFKVEDKINRLLKQFKESDIITDDTFRDFYCSSSSYGILYGLPKTHKENLPLRPILAAYNNPNYQIAKHLVPLLQPLATNEYTLLNSANLIPDILPQDTDLYLVSFDVASLFTNIPLQETIDIILNKIFYNDQITFHGFDRENFNKLLQIAVQDTYFLFNNKIYKQIDGVSMGSPLAPIMANIFMCFLEEKMLDDCPLNFRPLFYKRYVDDTIALFRSRDQAEQFLEHINDLHPNIKFTIEHESNNQLPFLDILISRTDHGFSTNVFRKKTFTGQGTNFYSSCPLRFKLNSISTLLHRAYSLCSSWQNFHTEVSFLLQYFKLNSYPPSLIQKFTKDFLNNKFQPPQLTPSVPKLLCISDLVNPWFLFFTSKLHCWLTWY